MYLKWEKITFLTRFPRSSSILHQPEKNSILGLGIIYKWRHGLRGSGYQGFCDDSNKFLLLKSVTLGGKGIKKDPKLRDAFHGWPLIKSLCDVTVTGKDLFEWQSLMTKDLVKGCPFWRSFWRQSNKLKQIELAKERKRERKT